VSRRLLCPGEAGFAIVRLAGERVALEEVAALKARNLDPALPSMRAHGVPGLMAYLNGEITLDAAALRGKADTRAYAKRQVTWFRHQMPGWRQHVPEAAEAAVLAAFGITT
ncbi:MAG: hypothetical protein HC829_01960, partial [Bacteroidales bacterium]|nr:hypothetical protein [Bacteroidales bacterium]